MGSNGSARACSQQQNTAHILYPSIGGIMNPCVYMLRLATGKHFYIGTTQHLSHRLQSHCHLTPRGLPSQSKSWGSYATRTYGFSGEPHDILGIFPCQTSEEAYKLEWDLACKLRQLCPDTAICSDSYSFGAFNSSNYD